MSKHTALDSSRTNKRYLLIAVTYHASENSPFLRWMNRSCLGLDDSAKTYQQISTSWILDSPEHLRSAFLQGLADGDGSVSLKGRYVCITTTQNQDFVQKLVSSFDVQTRIIGGDVVSQGYDGARQFASISPFRHAKTRDESSQRLVKMIDSKRHIRDNQIKPFEIDFIKKLQSEGLSSWEISQRFLDNYDDLIDERTIQHLMDKMDNKNS